MLQQNNITSLIPQQQPFVMVDELLYADDNISRTSFTVKKDNVMVDGGFFTEAGLMENMAQTAAAGAGYAATQTGKPVEAGYIAAVKNFEVLTLPAVNDVLLTEAVFKDQVFNVTMVTCTVKCNNNLVATCEMKIFTGSAA